MIVYEENGIVETYVTMLFEACNEILKFIKDHDEQYPESPIFNLKNFITDSLKINQYSELYANEITFVCTDGLCYTTWLPQPYLDDFRKAKAFPINQKGQLTAKSITVWKGKYFTGMAIAGNDRWFNINPEAVWGSIWSYVWNQALPDGLKLEGEDAYRFWSANFELYQAYEAAFFSLYIGRTPELLPYFKQYKPYLFDHPVIKDELTKAYMENLIQKLPKTEGRPHDVTQQKFDLYFWVYFYRFAGKSLNEACKLAITEHRELVPDSWLDTDATLKKFVQRLDKIPGISQKAGFNLFTKQKKTKHS
jgi:hypothetical protein